MPSAAAFAQQPPKLRLAEVQDVAPTSYRVKLDLDPAKDIFSGSIQISLTVKKPFTTLWLNTSELTLQKIELITSGKQFSGTAVSGDSNFTGLKFQSEIANGTAELTIDYAGRIRSPQPAGIFVSQDSGNKYLLTQFETSDARDAFPCFDEPTYKVPWQVTLIVPSSDSAVSNTPVENESKSGDTKTVVFRQTKPLPSYLVAFGVGPFEFVDGGTAGRNHVPVRIVTPKGRAADAQYAAEVTATILTRLEDYFGIPYPYEKADQVVIPIPSGFAMENAGMVTYSGSTILAKAQSDTIHRQHEYAEVAAHELAHQWFGDLVTTDWWNDTWLNEAFATWMEGKIIAQWKPDWNTRASEVSEHLRAEREDSLPSTRRIRQKIESVGDIDNAFDDITYQKGATVIGMFENWIGEDKFQQGVRNYLNTYAFKTATTSDFLAALSEASGKDVRNAFSTFVDQPGIPVVGVSLECGQNASSKLKLEQSRFSSVPSKGSDDQLWSIPVCTRYDAGGKEEKQCTLLTRKTADVSLQSNACPAWVAANADAVGYYRASYQKDLLEKLTSGDVEHRLSPAERVSLLGDTVAFAGANALSYPELLKLVSRFCEDPVPPVVLSALNAVSGAQVLSLVGLGKAEPASASTEKGYQHYLAATFGKRARELGWLAKEGESDSVKQIRPDLLFIVSSLGGDQALASEAQNLAEKWLAGDRSLDPNVAGSVLQVAAFYGNASTARQFLAVYRKSRDVQDRSRLVRALADFRDRAALDVSLNAILSGEIPVSESIVLLSGGRFAESTRRVPFEFIKSHYPEFEKLIPPLERSYLPLVGNGFCDAQSKHEFETFFEPQLEHTPGMRRTFAQVSENIDRCIANRQSQAPALAAFLKNQH
jgi:cytosol alanyl aminopeptidase